MPPPAPTARLAFRCWRDDDLPLSRALWCDPRVMELLGGAYDEPRLRERLAREMANERDHGFQYWPLFLTGGAHAGCCGLKPKRTGVLELGFQLRPEHWGQGLAVEASRAVVAHAFAALGAQALEAGHHPRNETSKRVLEKLGFRRAGEELYPPTGLIHPNYVLAAPG
jgi:RimJ/RimL family protein N-acetyltransferase